MKLTTGLVSIFILVSSLIVSCSSTMNQEPAVTLEYAPVAAEAPLPESVISANLTQPAAARGIVDRFTRSIEFYLPAGTALNSLVPNFKTKGVQLVSPKGAQDLSVAVKYTFSDGSVYSVKAYNTVPTAQTVNRWIGSGINLGNDLDAWYLPVSSKDQEGSWTGNVVATKDFFDDYKKMGFTSVRIPVTWGQDSTHRLSSNGISSTVDPAFMKRVETIVGWAIDAGLTVVLNAHHEDWIRTKTGSDFTNQIDRFKALWTEISTRFQSWPPQLVFEILNEPQGPITNSEVNTLNSAILATIRSSNPTRVVIEGANSWNSIAALQDGIFTLPSPQVDPYIIATFHNYNPWSFAGESSGTWGSASDVASIESMLTKVADWARAKGVPLNMGEYGVTFVYKGAKTDLASRARWYQVVSSKAKSLGISRAAWDDFGDFKLYDRSNRAYDNTVIPTIAP